MSAAKESTQTVQLTDFGSSDGDSDDQEVREKVIDAVGDGGVIENVDTEGCVVGDDSVVLWYPDGRESPMKLKESQYTDPGVAEWEVGYTDFEDGRTVALFTLTDGDSRSRVDAEKVTAVAEEMEMMTSDLLEKAKIHNHDDFPVRFDVDDGQLTVSPILKSDDKIRDSR
jgi:hypothetical protein